MTKYYSTKIRLPENENKQTILILSTVLYLIICIIVVTDATVTAVLVTGVY